MPALMVAGVVNKSINPIVAKYAPTYLQIDGSGAHV